MYQGTFNGSRVCIERMRVYIQDGPKRTAKVRYQRCRLPCSSSLTKLTDLLSRGRYMETLDAP